jgi:hypothetical protein
MKPSGVSIRSPSAKSGSTTLSSRATRRGRTLFLLGAVAAGARPRAAGSAACPACHRSGAQGVAPLPRARRHRPRLQRQPAAGRRIHQARLQAGLRWRHDLSRARLASVNLRRRCRSKPSCWRPTRPTFRQSGRRVAAMHAGPVAAHCAGAGRTARHFAATGSCRGHHVQRDTAVLPGSGADTLNGSFPPRNNPNQNRSHP